MPEDTNAGVGIIYPPPDIRGVIDKTAQFVAKCGEEFEKRVLREQNHQKFAFLLPTNPYRAYYDHKVKEFKTGVVEETKPEVPQAIAEAKAKEEEKKKRKEQLKMLTLGEKRKKIAKPPPPDQYVVNHPYIAPMDMDIIKLTAQFVARNGQKFLIGLTQRESRNPQFDFLKPTHALFGYFTSLVDAYTKCLMPNKDEVEKLSKLANAPLDILDKASARFAWDEQEEAMREGREEEERQEKEQMQMIDWHDFTVVETIEFTKEDENMPLAPPIDVTTGAPQGPPVSLDQGGIGTLSQEARIEKPKGVEEEEREEVAVDLEKEERERKEREAEEERRKKMEEEERQKEEEEEERKKQQEEEDAIQEEPMELEPEIPLPAQDVEVKVVKDYVRPKKGTAQRLTQRCPITGQHIAAEEMSNHLKILLLDPKWKQQKDALLERARKESAFADDVEANLAAFVAKRPDLFGSVDEQIREAAEAGAEAAARDAGADAGPAHTMVPQQQQAAISATASRATPALPTAGGPAAGGAAQAALPGTGPITGISTVNARLTPSVAATPQQQPMQLPGMPSIAPPGGAPAPPVDDDEDEDNDPTARKPDPGTLLPAAQWAEKHPRPIKIAIQVQLGQEALAANLPPVMQLDLSVRTTVLAVKQMLAPKVAAAFVTFSTMKLKQEGTNYILKNAQTLAYYNIGPGAVIVLTKKQRGGAR
mmetsp:Transcript_38876/g.91526  ORF Transcript_38876/g.91526 Transcript_38876/m.91526 type:complete len:705 (-) Transcript_38876:79-2193(-)